jgi:glucose/arabinose dehydrogenase
MTNLTSITPDNSLGQFALPNSASDWAGAASVDQLIFIDTAVENVEELISGINSGRIVVLDPTQDAVKQITAVLEQHQNLSSVHILSHGATGTLQLGGVTLSTETLPKYQEVLQQWRSALTSEADILFYGCNVADTSAGVDFVQQVAQLTGADVAASTDLTGGAAQGGNWQLEFATGRIESGLVVESEVAQRYTGTLAIYNGNEYVLTSGSLTWEQAQAEARRLGGNLVTINDAAEETWLKQTFGSTQGYWIGLTDRRIEGQYEWVSGESSAYRNWAPGEPNNFRGNEDFIQMNFGSTSRWNDESATRRFRGVVEIKSVSYNGKLYRLTDANLTWEQAQTQAQQFGGNLVTVNDAAEESWIKQTFGTHPYWIGLTDRRVEGQYEWASGEFSTYRNWAPGEPNNAGGNEDFISMNFGSTGRWNDYGATTRLRGLVEIDPAPLGTIALEQNLYSVNEFAGSVNIAIVRSGSSSGSATVQYRADSNTATAGSDFANTAGTLTFAPGETRKLIPVSIQNDNQTEGNEQFGFVIESPTGANLGTVRTAMVTILDDDSPTLTINPVQTTENSGEAIVTVSRGNGIGTASVDYLTENDTALANSDYQPVSGRLTFNQGELSKTIRVPLINDAMGEPNETFRLRFSNPTGVNLGSPNPVPITVLDDDPGSFVRETVFSGFSEPTAFARTPNSDLMFVAEKSGIVKVVRNNAVLTTPFIDLSRDVNNVRDRGLLGIAVHPEFYQGNPYVYLAYTYDPPEAYDSSEPNDINLNPNTTLDDIDQPGNRPARVVRVTADASTNFTRAVANSQVVIVGQQSTWANTSRPDGNSTVNFSIPESGRNPDGSFVQDYIKTDSESHTIGQLAFGADGALYISIGDGTSYNRVDPRTVSVLDPNSLSGKMLRVDALTGAGLSDNPFFDGNPNSNRSKVWNLGLRNPFRFAMQPGTSTPFIGDVGWGTWEEVNAGTRGANFGWPAFEGGSNGSVVQPSYDDLPVIQDFIRDNSSLVQAPTYARNHSSGARAIIVGDFYDGTTFPSLYNGALFVADVNEGTVDALTLNSQNQVVSVQRFAAGLPGIVYMETGADGNLYSVDLITGSINRWRPVA